jgi:hypothetical protein
MGHYFLKQILCKSCSTNFWSPSDQNSPQQNDKVLGNFDTDYNYLAKMLKFQKKKFKEKKSLKEFFKMF